MNLKDSILLSWGGIIRLNPFTPSAIIPGAVEERSMRRDRWSHLNATQLQYTLRTQPVLGLKGAARGSRLRTRDRIGMEPLALGGLLTRGDLHAA